MYRANRASGLDTDADDVTIQDVFGTDRDTDLDRIEPPF